MRRADREITEFDEIIKVMQNCDSCNLALNGDDGYPYVIALNFGMENDGENVKLYFHSANEGRKLDLIKKNNRAAFEMDCNHILQYMAARGYCTMAYDSVCGRGTIEILPDDEKIPELKRIMAQYHKVENAVFAEGALPRTTVYRLNVESITGKRKKPKAI